jgi:ParB-like chromosome segregation protein Spo0J
MKIEMRDPKTLLVYKNNARTHNEKQIEELIKSINSFGFNDPIEIGNDDIIISGHARVRAAIQVGLDLIPTVTLDLDKNSSKAYTLAANQIAQHADWDEELLKIEFEDLQKVDFNLELTGFTVQEIEKILNPEDMQELLQKDYSDSIKNKFIVEINCINESEQEKLFNELQERGHECRILTL